MLAFRLSAFVALVAIGTALAGGCGSEDAPEGAVHVLHADGTVGPIMERYLDRGIGRAEDNGGKLVVIELDTPGGLDSSMRDIVKRIERATVPVAVFVWPVGGRAASAGTFITMAGHLAVMAPNTSIGAASAINSDGTDIEGDLGRKVENDAVAFIRGIAELRGRNADWAEDAVRDAVAVNQNDAVELNVVDYVANDLPDLLRQAEGRMFELRPGTMVTLEGLAEAPLVRTDQTVWEDFLAFISDPTVASLLLTLGFFALLIEMAVPGHIGPGAIGVVAIALGFLGFNILPVDTVGLVLIGLGLLLLALEIFVTTGGILGAAGGVALVVGTIVAFRETPADFRPPTWLLALLGAVIAAMFLSLATTVARVRKIVVATGTSALVGKQAIARTPLTPEGFVFIRGERWQARLADGEAQPGDRVRVVGAEGLRLNVERDQPESAGPESSEDEEKEP
jgi:membrane-bound serine protease (ClpP class)